MSTDIDNHILPECYIDTNLIETLVPTKRGYNHQKGCPAVAKRMQEKFGDSFALGIMDKDKRKVPYLQEFYLVASTETIEIYKHHEKPHYILLVAPAAEMFILNAASEAKISLSEYGIPKTLEEMKRETKQVDATSSKKYERLFKALRHSPTFKKLADVIGYLKTETYRAQDNELQNLLNK